MNRWQRPAAPWVVPLVVVLPSFIIWSALWPSVAPVFDAWWRLPTPAHTSATGQIAAAISLLFSPPVVALAMGALTWWSARQRLHSVAGAIVLATVLTWSLSTVMQHVVQRPHPETAWDFLLTTTRYGYPSTQVAMVTAGALLVVAVTTMTRQSAAVVWTWRALGFFAVLLVAVTRLLLGLAAVTDVVGGAWIALLGTLFSLALCDVQTVVWRRSTKQRGTAAIIYNPTKIADPTTFMRIVNAAVKDAGWESLNWLATTADDPGYAMARTAKSDGVELVLIAGGDGTVRVVCGELANSGITAAIIPAGTGNLLARNLNIPLDYSRALDLLKTGHTAGIDLIRFTMPDGQHEYSAVMAGVGADAAVMNDTDENLKRAIGSLAYVAAGLNHLRTEPMQAVVTIDDEERHVEAALISIGNVGDLQAGVSIMPEASASDGVMDLLIANPANPAQVAQLAAAVLSGATDVPHLERATAKKLVVQLREPTPFQIDGDVVGEVDRLECEIQHRVLNLLIPH